MAKIPQHFVLTFLNSSPGYLEKIQLFVFSPKNLKGANDFSIPLTQCCCFFCCGRLIIHSFFNFFFWWSVAWQICIFRQWSSG